MPCALATALSVEDHSWHVPWSYGLGQTRSARHHFFSNFTEQHSAEHSETSHDIVGKGLSKETKQLPSGSKDSAGGVDQAAAGKEDAPAKQKSVAKEEKPTEKPTEKSGDVKKTEKTAAAPNEEVQSQGKGKGKGKGKGFVEDAKGKGKGKGSHGHHGRHHSRHHRRRHRSLSGSHHRRHSAAKRMKRLLQRQRQLRSMSPQRHRRSLRSLSPWRGHGRQHFPSRSVASLRRSVGLLEVPDQLRSARVLKSAAAAAPLDPILWERPGRRHKEAVTAFLFGIGKDANEAARVDAETDQMEIEEEAKTIVNAEGAGYDQPIGVAEGEEEEFEHEAEAAQAHPDVANQPTGPGCQCPAWDPLTTALPEDKQHASLVMLQRRIRPENQVAPSLREAASAVEHAGRLFEGWVNRRQQLADVLPELAAKMESCHNRAKNFAKSEAQQALNGLKERLEEEEDAEADAEERAEMAEGQMRFQAVEEAQQDFNEAQGQGYDAGYGGYGGYDGYGGYGGHGGHGGYGYGQHGVGAGQQPDQTAFMAQGAQGTEQLAQAMGQIYGHGGRPPGAAPGEESQMEEAAMPEDAALEAPKQLEVEDEMRDETDFEEAKEVENFGDFFRECGEFRIPATVLAARRAANEAYWAFDRAMQVAEKKVGRAIQHSLIRGA